MPHERKPRPRRATFSRYITDVRQVIQYLEPAQHKVYTALLAGAEGRPAVAVLTEGEIAWRAQVPRRWTTRILCMLTALDLIEPIKGRGWKLNYALEAQPHSRRAKEAA